MIKKIQNFLSQKGNGFLLWGLTISVFFLYSFNKSDLEKAWAGIVSLPEIAQKVKEIQVNQHEFEKKMIFRTNVLKRDISRQDTTNKKKFDAFEQRLNTLIRHSVINKNSQDSIKKLIKNGDNHSNNTNFGEYSHNNIKSEENE